MPAKTCRVINRWRTRSGRHSFGGAPSHQVPSGVNGTLSNHQCRQRNPRNIKTRPEAGSCKASVRDKVVLEKDRAPIPLSRDSRGRALRQRLIHPYLMVQRQIGPEVLPEYIRRISARVAKCWLFVSRQLGLARDWVSLPRGKPTSLTPRQSCGAPMIKWPVLADDGSSPSVSFLRQP